MLDDVENVATVCLQNQFGLLDDEMAEHPGPGATPERVVIPGPLLGFL